MEISIVDILAARDKRAATQKRLLEAFGKPLICFTMNIAGPVKYSPQIEKAYGLGKELLLARLAPVHMEESISATGCEGFFVAELPAEELKAICVAIEDSQPLCRLFDMDVLSADGRKLSREDIGMAGRRCLLCDAPAHQCSSRRVHPVDQLQAETARLLAMDDQQVFLASLAYQALVAEVRTTPKPGLVDEAGNGSHRDMDLGLFLKSADSLRDYLYAAAGCRDFDRLRQLGLAAEQAMLAATGGVNTHKGAIFTMGILCAAAGMGGDIFANCRQLCRDLVQRDLGQVTESTARTVGERLYARFGITGIRGQAEAGFPAVERVGLPVLRQGLQAGLSGNRAGCAALLHILCSLEDTNLIARSDVDTARAVTARVADILAECTYPAPEILRQLDADFIKENLSPGGSADLLAATYFMYYLGNKNGTAETKS